MFAVDLARHSEGDVLSHSGGACDVLALALCREATALHAQVDLVATNAAGTYANGVVESGVEHVHQVGRYGSSGGGRNDVVLLGEVAAYDVACGIGHEDVAGEAILAGCSSGEAIRARGTYLSAVDENLRALCRIDSSHENFAVEDFTRHERGALCCYISVEFVYTNVFEVDIGAERVEHLILGLANIALEL